MDRDRIRSLAEAQRAYVTAARRHLHQHPELSFHEHETAAFIAERLTVTANIRWNFNGPSAA